MTKKIERLRFREIIHSVDTEVILDDKTPQEVVSYINKLLKDVDEKYTDLRFELESDEYINETALYGWREETDEEYQQRLKELKEYEDTKKLRAQQRRDMEYETYKRLHKRYNKKLEKELKIR